MSFPVIKKSLFYLIAILLNYSLCWCQIKNTSPIPSSSRQMILVITNSFKASNGFLFRFERDNANADWEKSGDKIPVIVGKNGLAWGIGLHKLYTTNTPIKREGDRKSPAGIFTLSSVFGYSPVEKMGSLKIPYIHVTDILECIDDVNSKYYNSFVNRGKVENVDWHSSEKMLLSGIWYELGVVVDHNKNPIKKGAGSCIFLHNWAGSADSTSGCTAMAPSDMKDIIYWLDASKNPILVQLTRQLFINYKKSWELPELREGKIADQARDLRKTLREAKFSKASQGLSKFFKEFKNYEICYKVLGAMVKLRCNRVCKDSGGPPFCKIRKCCQKKGIDGCWECDEYETCEKLDFLKPIHEDAHIKNLRQIRKLGTEAFINGKRYW